ncbi:MAG: response regulator [Anaerolineae bacterium]|nr:response regulator [Gemmatimonadaceae bacterium]
MPLPRSLRLHAGVTLAQIVCGLTIAYFAFIAATGGHAGTIGDVLMSAQVVLALVVYARATDRARGTRRMLFAGLAGSATFAALGHGWWAVLGLVGRPLSPGAAAVAGLAAQICIFVGFAAALARQRTRLRFEVLADALLLVVAAAIMIVQLEAATPLNAGGSGIIRFAPVGWSIVSEGSLILIALLLALHGDVLGRRMATGFALGTVFLAVGNVLFSRAPLFANPRIEFTAAILWSLATLSFVWSARSVVTGPKAALRSLAPTTEVPVFSRDSARIRIIAIVAAILIVMGSTVVGLASHDNAPGLAFAVAIFGVVLAARTGHALWLSQRSTTELERTVVAEREVSATLEFKVVERTEALGEAQRVLQRMWTLGQQIAFELNSDRVLERFIEAVVDVVRADAAAIALTTDADTLRIEHATGPALPLRGKTFAIRDSLMGRATLSGKPARYENIFDCKDGPSPATALLMADPVRGVAIIPLLRRGERIGAIAVGSRAPRLFSDAEVARLETLADLLAVALANAELVETLRQAEWRFRTLFRAAPDAVLTMFESGRIREANDAVRDVLGVYSLQAIGRTLDEFAVPADRERVKLELARAFAGEAVRFEARFQREGAVHTLSLAARLLPEASPPTVLCVGRDVTAERDMRARLVETERLAAVGQLVAGVAHEVNNPLSTISAFAQLLLRDGGLSADQRESLDVIQGETVRASQVVKDLLTFARRSESQPQPLDLNELIERTVRVSGYELGGKHIVVHTTLAPLLPSVYGDPRQLQQVILNLVTNAVQAMAADGSGTLRITSRTERDKVVLEVADTGPGVPERARAHIFEPFFTTKSEGTGLGLSVSYGIVTAHGGTITIASTSRDGTVFRVSLPCDVGAVGETLSVAPELVEPALEGVRMLFVDDEPSLRSAMVAFGKLRRMSVTTAQDGQAALSFTCKQEFDIVICDLRMPGMDGPTFFEVLSRENPSLASRTIFMTGDVVGESSRRFLDSTSQPVLSKPFDFEKLEEAVLALMTESQEAAIVGSDTG